MSYDGPGEMQADGTIVVEDNEQLREAAREAGLPVDEDETKTLGYCKNCGDPLPDDDHKSLNLGIGNGYCGLGCRIEAEDGVDAD